jgi:hypothetical protein
MMMVAAVAELICDKCVKETNKEDVVAAALIHDLGNFVKMTFDGDTEIRLLDKEDHNKIELYKQKKKEFIEKYGPHDWKANELIAKEIGVNENVLYLLHHKEVFHAPREEWENNFGLMIFFYADLRVSPNGVTGLEERLAEFRKRHKLFEQKDQAEYSKKFNEFALKLEKEIFEYIKITPEAITNEAIKRYYDKY